MKVHQQLSQIFRRPALSPGTIDRRRQQVAARVMDASRVLRKPDFSAIARPDLFEMFQGYDEQFFENALQREIDSGTCRLRLRLSTRMTSTGGLTSFRQQLVQGRPVACFEIAISSTLLFSSDFASQPVRVAGVIVHNRLDALQRIFEHELVHLTEMRTWGDSSCARSRFRNTVRNLFGHRESSHQLITPAEQARTDQGLGVGDPVEFLFRGRRLRGIINRINRRATVLVEHAAGELYEDGRRYVRFYVPVPELGRAHVW